MYLYDYLIYRLNPYGIENIRHEMQSIPSPPPDAQLKVLVRLKTFFFLI